MRAFLLLAKLRIVDVTRDRGSSFLFLGLPILLMVVIGITFMNGHPFERRRVAVVSASGVVPEEVRSRISPEAEIRLSAEPSEEAALGKLRGRMVTAIWIEGGGRRRIVVGPREEHFGRGLAAAMSPALEVEIVRLPRWGYVHYLVPGILTFTVMLAGLFGMGYAMVRYRQNLFLKKLATTPLPRSTFVAANIVGRGSMVLVQMVILMTAAHFGFGVPVTPLAALWLVVLTLLGVLVFMGAGFCLACLIKNEAVVVDVINSVLTVLVFLSEIFFAADELPAPLPAIAGALPSTQMVRLTRAVLLLGETRPAALLPGLLLIGGWIVVTFGASLLAFRWHDP